MTIAPDLAPQTSRAKVGRSAVPVRARRGKSFRRSDIARFRPASGPSTGERSALGVAHSLWARCAVPGGMLVFWTWFAVANWQHLQQLFG